MQNRILARTVPSMTSRSVLNDFRTFWSNLKISHLNLFQDPLKKYYSILLTVIWFIRIKGNWEKNKVWWRQASWYFVSSLVPYFLSYCIITYKYCSMYKSCAQSSLFGYHICHCLCYPYKFLESFDILPIHGDGFFSWEEESWYF